MSKLTEGFDPRMSSAWRSYAMAIISVMAAALVTWACREWLGWQIAKPFFFGAVMVTSIYGGLRPGLATVLLASLTMTFFFVPPAFSLRVGADSVMGIVLFVLFSLVLSLVCAFVRLVREFFSET
jgi:K+-sensing histidine kinase KdpD